MSSPHHLVVALGRSWGRVRIAHDIATALCANGERVTLLFNQALAGKLTGTGVRLQPVRDDMGPLLRPYLDSVIAQARPETIVLCDYSSNATVLGQNGVEPTRLLRDDVRVCALDIWDIDVTGVEADVFDGRQPASGAPTWADALRRTERLRPVPILWPRGQGSGHFCYLPEPGRPAMADRRDARQRLGIGSREKVVLFCTAKWQHRTYPSAAGERMAAALPRLLADDLGRAGNDVHLVHVGPASLGLESQLGARYHWVAPVSIAAFEALLASADLLISANVSASTVAGAMQVDVPVLILQNAIGADSVDEAEAAFGRPLSPRRRDWLASSLPFYPFALWPIGFHRFLSPVLRGNPYMEAVTVAELLDDAGVESALSRLLRDPGGRADQLQRQAAYLRRVRSLPSVVDLIAAHTAR